MDYVAIRSPKAQYRKNVILKIIRCVEKKKTLTKIFLLLGMQMIVAAWNAATTKIVVNCFQKSKISGES